MRFHDLIAKGCQGIVKEIPFLFIFSDVHRVLLQGSNQPLHQRRGIDKTESSVGEDNGSDHLIQVFTERTDCHIANSLSGEGEVFRVGGHTNRMRVTTEDDGELHLIEDDPAVGFICNQMERFAQLPTFLF